VNLRGPVLLAREVIPLQRRQGSGVIVNNASTLGLKPVPGVAAYAVSKAALIMLTRCLALEEAPHGIRALAICPGVVDTPIHEVPGGKNAAFLDEMGKLHPLGRVGTADEVAALVEFLVGPEASWMTGSVVTIDGGISI
jgi:NAD(P)-dependent dehydrogenase (short-subunit alcohol dehydrogenase family)